MTRHPSSARAIAAATAVVVMTFLIATIGCWVAIGVFNERRIATEMERSYRSILDAKKLELLMREAEAYQREYILSGDEISLVRFHEALSSLRSTFNEFELASLSDENRLERIWSVAGLLEQRIAELLNSANLRERGGTSVTQVADPTQGRQLMEGLHFNLAWIFHEEENRLRVLRAAKERTDNHAVVGLLVSISLAFGVIACFTIFMKSQSSRLADVAT